MKKLICREPIYSKWLTSNKSGLTFIDNWSPELNSVKLYELFNDKKNINPQTALVLSDAGMIYEDANGYLNWFNKSGFSKNALNAPKVTFYKKLLEECYQKISSAEKIFKVKKDGTYYLYLSPVYSGWNIGHDLSTLVYTCLSYIIASKKYPEKSIKVVVSSQAISASNNTSDLISILFPRDELVLIEPEKLYEFDNFIIPPACYFHLQNRIYPLAGGCLSEINHILDYIIKHCKNLFHGNSVMNKLIEECDGKFILSKLERHNAFRKEGIMPDKVVDKFVSSGWQVIDPEKHTFFEVVYLLSNAKKVLLGSGAIQYAHKYFINENALIYIIFGGKHNYPQYNKHNNPPRMLKFPEIGCLENKSLQRWEEMFDKIAK